MPILLGIPGVTCVLSERFCQDPLESFFGKQRYKDGRNENPSVKEFIDNTVSLRVQGSAALEPLRGNYSRKRNAPALVDWAPLPKRKRPAPLWTHIIFVVYIHVINVHVEGFLNGRMIIGYMSDFLIGDRFAMIIERRIQAN